jgi:hypothetical protein
MTFLIPAGLCIFKWKGYVLSLVLIGLIKQHYLSMIDRKLTPNVITH